MNLKIAPSSDRPMSQSQRAVEELRDLIIHNELPAGAIYLETELAEMMGMSRTPVREAALVLEAQGLVEVRPRKGVRITPVSIKDMREIYDILTEVESLAAFNAAQSNYSDDDLATLEKSISDMERALDDDDRIAWAGADDLFHEELLRLGKNERAVLIASMMADQVARAKRSTLFIRPKPSKSNKDHRGVLDAIKSGDADAARRIHQIHRTAARDMLIDILTKHQMLNI